MSRTKSIKIRLTDNEHQRLKARAGARGVSALLRIQALRPDRRQKQREQFALIAELARARNLLHQIARNSERGCRPNKFRSSRSSLLWSGNFRISKRNDYWIFTLRQWR